MARKISSYEKKGRYSKESNTARKKKKQESTPSSRSSKGGTAQRATQRAKISKASPYLLEHQNGTIINNRQNAKLSLQAKRQQFHNSQAELVLCQKPKDPKLNCNR